MSLRIAFLAHSTNPRGGVVHALEVGDALAALGHTAVVHAPDVSRTGFFRPSRCRAVSVPAAPVAGDLTALVRARIAEYVRYFEQPEARAFDIWHAGDGISGNALATLKERGLIRAFARTVHHIDAFTDPALIALQQRSIAAADLLFTVSPLWRQTLADTFDREAAVVGNGVDLARFSPVPDASDVRLRDRLGPGEGPMLLAIGGVEGRKNTLGILEAFIRLRGHHIAARLVIAGGATLLDHTPYRRAFDAHLAASGLPAAAVTILGPLPQDLMPALYRAADVLMFPSLKEGFGLVVLEAMASGVPVVTARIEPFTGYLGAEDVAWCDPADPASITAAAEEALRRTDLAANGRRVAERHTWAAVAARHVAAYASLREKTDA